MSQKREKEKTLELKVPAEALTLCPENCKITSTNSSTSNPTTTSSQICVGSSSEPSRIEGGSSDEAGPRSDKSLEKEDVAADGRGSRGSFADGDVGEPPAKRTVNRCSGCKRRVGLTGFRCRCGELFCWEHRYSDRHDCSYDYKTAGREAIARENPVVRAAKILKV
ncbi:switch-activating protein Sap1 [Ancistrocladus abbreviatus]